ncbi:MAG: glycosyl transferase, partial [Janthinobacterium sp.]
MFSFIVSFVASALFTLLIIKQVRLHKSALDSDFHGVQKVHSHSVARIGGLAIFVAVLLSAFVSIWRLPVMTYWMLSLLLCSGIAFAGGIIEDFTGKVSPLGRLLLTMGGALLAYFLIDARIDRIDLPFSSWVIPFIWLSLPITVLAVAG